MTADFAGLRIAYFTEWSPYQANGVLRKLIGQIDAWRELGVDARLFALAARHQAGPTADFARVGAAFGRFTQDSLERWPWLRLGYVNKIASGAQVAKAIRSFRPDLLYYRQQGPWYPGLGVLLKIAPTVIEINTDEFAEIRIWHPVLGRGLAALQGMVHKRASGFVAVTHEIGSRWLTFGKPVAVVPNSFWGDQPPEVPASGNSQPRFVFIGSRLTGESDWHGVDKILCLARSVPHRDFHLIGLSRGDFAGVDVPGNVVFHGRQDPAGVASIFSQCDVGIGSLAMHRTNLDEGCPLKVRDYLMHRMPVVIGYREAEVSLNHAPYVLQLPNTEDSIPANVDRIVAFGDHWCNRRVPDDLAFMSRRSAETRRLKFLSGLT